MLPGTPGRWASAPGGGCPSPPRVGSGSTPRGRTSPEQVVCAARAGAGARARAARARARVRAARSRPGPAAGRAPRCCGMPGGRAGRQATTSVLEFLSSVRQSSVRRVNRGRGARAGAEIWGKCQVPGLKRLPRHPGRRAFRPLLPPRRAALAPAALLPRPIGAQLECCPEGEKSGGECGAPRGGGGGGGGRHGIRGCLGRRTGPGTWLFPRSLPPSVLRAPAPAAAEVL